MMDVNNKKHILVVDDEISILDICRRILELNGYQVSTALNALLGLDVLGHEKIDLIISDLKMPLMDGLTFLEKSKSQFPETGFILITGYWMSNKDEIEKNRSRLYAVLKKPFEFSELVSLTEKYFHENSQSSQKQGPAT